MPKRIMLLVFASLVATIPMTIRSADRMRRTREPEEARGWGVAMIGETNAKANHVARLRQSCRNDPDDDPIRRRCAGPRGLCRRARPRAARGQPLVLSCG